MKYVINASYGGFELPEEYWNSRSSKAEVPWEDADDVRTDPKLIDIVEAPDYDGDLKVVIIPDDATDTYLVEYDGAEELLYVLNGKIYSA